MAHEFKVTYRIDSSEVFETDDYVIEADSLLDAAQRATTEVEAAGNTVIAVERRI